MWQQASARTRWALVVAAAALVLAALNVWWFETYRHGYPFDIDEAGYTTFGLADYLGLRNGGLHGWWDAIQGQPTFAPLVPALTSLVVYAKPGLMNGFLVLTCFLVVLTMAVYGIGERLAGPRLGALAAFVTATMPGTFTFAREYVFALPTTALLACAVYALLRSDGMRKRGWAIACGAAIGLMLLARTMAIAYAPGVLVAAIVASVARRRGDLSGRFVNLALLIVTGVAVAATWYARNLQSVIDYLTNYGYGKQSAYYGPHHALISLTRLRKVAERMTTEDLFLPLAVVLTIGVVAVAVVVAKHLRPRGIRRTELTRLVRTDALSVAIVLAVGYAALMSSRNAGDGFTIPLTALIPVLAVLALRAFPSALIPATAILALIAGVNILSTSTIWAAASHARMISLPGFAETVPVVQGAPKAVLRIREQVPGPEATFDRHDALWLKSDTAVADMLAGLYGPGEAAPVVAFASRNRILNTNTVQLASLVKYQRAIPLVQILAEPSDSVATYIDQLTNRKFGMPPVLVTMSRNTGDFEPLVTQSYVETAAKRLGFQRVKALTLPDGRQLRVWQRKPALVSSRSSPAAIR
jgi:Dolichyl-phosphate-mannose-protein mannosyltransferase